CNLVVNLKTPFISQHNTHYSPAEIIKISEMSFCSNSECREVAYYNEYCKKHRRHCCKEKGCNLQISISEEYCTSHQSICKISGCSSRTSLNSDCAYHKRKREMEQERLRQERKIEQERLRQERKIEQERMRQEKEREERMRREREIEQERMRQIARKQELLYERNQLHQQISVKENMLNQLISSAKSKLCSKSILPAKKRKKETTYQNYLANLLDAQKRTQFGPNEVKEKKCLIKKLSNETVQNLCRAQMELNKLEVNLAELERKLSLIQI
ncbi:11970_t:CDS:1, partial [Cetraspora pellucida]